MRKIDNPPVCCKDGQFLPLMKGPSGRRGSGHVLGEGPLSSALMRGKVGEEMPAFHSDKNTKLQGRQ